MDDNDAKWERINNGMARAGQAFGEHRTTLLRELIEAPPGPSIKERAESYAEHRLMADRYAAGEGASNYLQPSVVEPFEPKVRRPSIIKLAWPYVWRIGGVLLYAAGTWLLAASV